MKEEALVEELWQAVANLIATEEHLLETARFLEEERVYYANLSSFVRRIRQTITGLIMKLEGYDPVLDTGKFRTGLGELWCATKHLLLVKVHLYESAQKFMDLDMKEEAARCIELSEALSRLIEDFLERIFGKREEVPTSP